MCNPVKQFFCGIVYLPLKVKIIGCLQIFFSIGKMHVGYFFYVASTNLIEYSIFLCFLIPLVWKIIGYSRKKEMGTMIYIVSVLLHYSIMKAWLTEQLTMVMWSTYSPVPWIRQVYMRWNSALDTQGKMLCYVKMDIYYCPLHLRKTQF